MNLSRKWLREFVTVEADDKEFAEAMTLSGSKVELTHDLGAEISNVVVGRVLSMERHPDSDHMWVCQVDAGQAEPVQIVTGAWNVHVGDLVPVALHKSTLPGGKKIEKGKLRGVLSNGMLCGLYEPSFGSVTVDGIDLATLYNKKESALAKSLRRRINMIFQDPYASLNPRWRVRDIIAEPIRVQKLLTDQKAIDDRVNELMSLVKLNPEDADKYPHQFSGGQRQRISIARALASNPDFLICDEPTSALDVSVQAQILNLMLSVQKKVGLTYLFISHNLSVVHHISDRVGVMYLGRLVELAPKKLLFKSPQHPYTKMLLDAIPDMKMTGKPRIPIKGEVPNPLNPPTGCAFHPRCPIACERCKKEKPQLRDIVIEGETVRVACHAVGD